MLDRVVVIKRKTKQKVLREGPVWFYVVPMMGTSVVGVRCARGRQEGVAVILGAVMSVCFCFSMIGYSGSEKAGLYGTPRRRKHLVAVAGPCRAGRTYFSFVASNLLSRLKHSRPPPTLPHRVVCEVCAYVNVQA